MCLVLTPAIGSTCAATAESGLRSVIQNSVSHVVFPERGSTYADTIDSLNPEALLKGVTDVDNQSNPNTCLTTDISILADDFVNGVHIVFFPPGRTLRTSWAQDRYQGRPRLSPVTGRGDVRSFWNSSDQGSRESDPTTRASRKKNGRCHLLLLIVF